MADGEARIDFTGDASKAQAAYDKLTREAAKMREQLRIANESAKKGSEQATIAVTQFAKTMQTASVASQAAAEGAKKWADGLKTMQVQAGAARADFSVLLSAMNRTVAVKEPFAAWTSGLARLKQQQDAWANGLQKIGQLRQQAFSPGTLAKSNWELASSEQSAMLSGLSLSGVLLKMPTALALSAGAIEVSRRALRDYRAELDASAAAQKEFHGKLAADVALTRDVGQADAIDKALGGIKGVPKEQARGVFAAVTSQAPTTGLGARMAMSQSIARLAPLNPEMAASVGGLAGQLSDVLPGMKPADVADVSAVLHKEAGGDISKVGGEKMQRAIRQLVAGGTPPNLAIAMALSAAQGKISPETLDKVAQVAGASQEDLMPGRRERGPQATAMRKLAGMSGAERITAMQSDMGLAKAALGAQALSFSRLRPEDITRNAAMVDRTTQEDTIGQIVGAAASTSVGRGQLRQAEAKANLGRLRGGRARQEELLAELDDAIRQKNIQQSGDNLVTSGVNSYVTANRRVGTAIFGAGEATPERNAALEKLVQLMQESVNVQKGMASEGKRRKNVDAHNE